MTLFFQCTSCQAKIKGADRLLGRKIRCPECDAIVEARQIVRETVSLLPTEGSGEQTVMLEAVEFEEEEAAIEPVEVTDALELTERDTFDGTSGPPLKPPPKREDPSELPRPIKPRRRLEDTEMDMTPMVDVTFLLLIFFMVTAAFSLQKSIQVPKPNSDDPSENVVQEDPEEQSDFVTVKVDEFNTYHVATVDWEEEAPSVQDLYVMLRRAREGDSTGTIPTKLRVEAHGDSLHERVVAALDAGTATGFTEHQLMTIEDE